MDILIHAINHVENKTIRKKIMRCQKCDNCKQERCNFCKYCVERSRFKKACIFKKVCLNKNLLK